MNNNVFTNGFPKSGNHALVKACELLGVPVRVNHTPYSDGVPEGTTHHLFIKRDPRNVIISMLRMEEKTVSPGMFITKFRVWKEGTSYKDDYGITHYIPSVSTIEAMTEYEPWLNDPNTYVIKYEDLIANDVEMKRIASIIDVPYLEDAFLDLPGLTATWNEEHSDYTKIWTPEVEAVWNAEGGKSLLERWGY